MPDWITDTAILTTLISTGYALTTFIIKRKDDKKRVQFERILEALDRLEIKVQSVEETTNCNQDGIKTIHRYRLFNDLKHEIGQGYTSLERYREIGILFDSYKNQGGNGEIEVLYEKYKELSIKD